MDTIAEKLVRHITAIQRWHSPAVVLVTFSDGTQAGFDASNDKTPTPNGDESSMAREFARNTHAIRSGPHGPEVVFHDGSWIICSPQNWQARHRD